MDKLKAKREERADKEQKFEALVEAAKSRALTTEEETLLDTLEKDMQKLDTEIKSLEDRESRSKTIAAKKAAAAVGAPQDNASENRELSKFSYAKAFTDVHNKKVGKRGEVSGFEREMHEEAHKEAEKCGIELSGNICIPSKLVKFVDHAHNRAPLSVGTEGTDVVETEFGGLISSLRPDPVVNRLGITKLTGLRGNLKWPRSTNDLALVWETETSAADETVPTFDAIDLSPKRLAGYTDVTLQMLHQSPFVMESFIRSKLTYAYEAAIDIAVLAGPTGGNSPVGILNYPGVSGVSLGTSGGDLTYAALLAMIREAQVDNARDGNSGFVMNPLGFYALAVTPRQASGIEGNFIINPDSRQVFGVPFIVTNRIPSNLTDTSGGSNLSAIIYSPRWASAILGTWGGLDILFDPYTQALNGTVRFVVNTFADVEIEHPEEFVVIKDWNTTTPALT